MTPAQSEFPRPAPSPHRMILTRPAGKAGHPRFRRRRPPCRRPCAPSLNQRRPLSATGDHTRLPLPRPAGAAFERRPPSAAPPGIHSSRPLGCRRSRVWRRARPLGKNSRRVHSNNLPLERQASPRPRQRRRGQLKPRPLRRRPLEPRIAHDGRTTFGSPGKRSYARLCVGQTRGLPYLEATNSRVHLKQGIEKSPFSIVNNRSIPLAG